VATKMSLEEQLAAFQAKNGFVGRGNLGLALVITRKAKTQGLPIEPATLLTRGGGQITGLSGSAINKILREYGETRNSGTEVGRTSRGTIGNAPIYASFLNNLNTEGAADLDFIEHWWITRRSNRSKFPCGARLLSFYWRLALSLHKRRVIVAAISGSASRTMRSASKTKRFSFRCISLRKIARWEPSPIFSIAPRTSIFPSNPVPPSNATSTPRSK
jgi:hypothetical protein